MSQSNTNTATSINLDIISQISLEQISKLNEFRFFYLQPNDNNFYHITCKMVLQFQNLENLISLEDEYDYEFFYQNSNASYHVTCKLLSNTLIVDILNKEFYGIDFNTNDLKRKYTLTRDQKIDLEMSLKNALPSLQDRIFESDSRVAFTLEAYTISNDIKLFYQPPHDDNFYHVTCEMVLQRMYDEDYDYEFFYLDPNTGYHVACKIMSHHLIVNLLNKKIYGVDFLDDLKRECNILLTSHKKFNLELNLKQVLPFYLYIPERQMRLNSGENATTFLEGINTPQTVSIIDNVMSGNDVIHQDINGVGDYNCQVTSLQQ
ncbi:unnamed protein product [Rhizophagus irregularis]|nr:unnamed protein product [Rhizophagus irregularis]